MKLKLADLKITHIVARDFVDNTFTTMTVAEAIKILESGKRLNNGGWSDIVEAIYSDGRKTALKGKYGYKGYGFYWLGGSFCEQAEQ